MQGFSNALINMMALFSAIILNSCVSTQYNINQNIPPKEACAFVLDTIHINNPVIIEYNNIRYVVDTPNVDSIPQKDIYAYLDSTFHYLLGDNIFYDLPNFLYDKVIKFYNDEVCEYVIDSNRKNQEKNAMCQPSIRILSLETSHSFFCESHSIFRSLHIVFLPPPESTLRPIMKL